MADLLRVDVAKLAARYDETKDRIENIDCPVEVAVLGDFGHGGPVATARLVDPGVYEMDVDPKEYDVSADFRLDPPGPLRLVGFTRVPKLRVVLGEDGQGISVAGFLAPGISTETVPADGPYPFPWGRLLDRLGDAVADIETALPNEIPPDEVARWHETAETLTMWAKRAEDASGSIREGCNMAIPRGERVESGGMTWQRTAKPSRKGWRIDDLLRAVNDSVRFNRSDEVLVLDDGTEVQPGEKIEETEAQKLMDVWNLGAPRIKALKARGLDPDKFCKTDWNDPDVRQVTDDDE